MLVVYPQADNTIQTEQEKGVIESMLRVEFEEIEQVADARFRFAVIVSRFQNRYVYCKHRKRDTWEIPGGTREPGEAILETARRELFEETGAKDFELHPVCAYAVVRSEKSYGLLCFAEIRDLDALPDSEIERIDLFEAAPEHMTYPEIQPLLFDRVRQWIKEFHIC